MSRALSTNGGAVDSLKASRRCGCSPKARQMRPTLEVELPLCRAILRVLQWVAPAGRLSSVCTMTCSTLASSTVRGPWSRFVEQPVEAALDKAPTPLADGLHRHPLARRNRLVAQARGATQHDARPQCQSLRRLAPLPIAFQYPRDFTRQFDLRYRATRSHPPPPMQLRRQIDTQISGSDTRLSWLPPAKEP